jgi:hypothetical protein
MVAVLQPDVCPICLEPSSGITEQCKNRHTMHLECARKMTFFMPLNCPLCRSKIICGKCKSSKTQLCCECSREMRNLSNVWDLMKKIYATHFFLTIAIFALPIKHVLLGLVLLLTNVVVMMRRIVCLQRNAEDVKSWNAISRWGLSFTHISMDILCGMFVAVIAFLLFCYIRTIAGLKAH